MIAVIDCETTGLVPYFHEVVDICILPLNADLSVSTEISAFEVAIRPEFPDRAEKKALEVNGHTLDELMARVIDRPTALNLFKEWYSRYFNRQTLEPLGHNWPFDKAFLTATFREIDLGKYFHYRARDTQAVANFLNDRAIAMATPGTVPTRPFASAALDNVARTLGIDTPNAHRARGDCETTAAVYRKFVYGK